jgi:hypothetical protein
MDMKDMTDDERDLAAELGKLGRIHAKAASSLPSAGLDENILARSREALGTAARPRRWWIPASVAATALIALSLVTRIQHEAVTGLPEAGVVTAPQPAAVTTDNSGEIAPAVAEPPPAPAATAPQAEQAEHAPGIAADGAMDKRSMPPRQAMPRMSSGPATPAAGDPTGAASLAAEEDAAAVLQESTAAVSPARKAERAASPLTPEAWLEMIEALEADGRTEEATRERALLEQAYPGWLSGRAGPH